MVLRVLSEFFVDQPEILDDGADGMRTHTLDRRVLLQQREHFEQGRGLTHEDLIVQRFEVAVANLKARVERLGRRTLIEDRLAEELQQQFVQQRHVHHGAVVTLHELLDREREGGIFVTEDAREFHLMVKQQPILAPPGDAVQRKAHFPKKRLGALQATQFSGRQKAEIDEIIEGIGTEVPLGDPSNGLDVAQAAGAGFDVGLEVVGRVVRLEMTLVLFAYLRVEELAHRPDRRRRECGAHAGHQRFRSSEMTCFD